MKFSRLPASPLGDEGVLALVFETGHGGRYALDAGRLHAEPRLLGPVSPAFRILLEALDLLAGGLMAAGVIGGFLAAWWLVPVSLIAGVGLRRANRRLAARLALSAASEEGRAFTYLYKAGLLWRLA